MAGARARPVLELQIHRTSAAGCSSDAAVEASTRAATTSARQPIPARPQPPFSYRAVPHFWCRIQLLVPGEMLLQGSYVLVQVTHRLVYVVSGAWRQCLVLSASHWPIPGREQSTSVTRRQRPAGRCTRSPLWN